LSQEYICINTLHKGDNDDDDDNNTLKFYRYVKYRHKGKAFPV